MIRDQPTESYKWGDYPGVAAVIEKYRLVHEINRAGSMLDNVMYFNLRLDRAMFEPDAPRGVLRGVERAAFTWMRTACCCVP